MKKQWRQWKILMMVWCLPLVCLSGTVRAEDVILSEEDSSFDESTEMEVCTEMEVEEPEELSEDSIFIEDIAEVPAETAEPENPVNLSVEGYEILEPETEIYINPLYRDVVSEEDLEEEEPDGFDVSPMAEEAEYLSVEEAVIFMRDQMKQRVKYIKFYVASTYDPSVTLKEETLAHTGVPAEGDYLKWQFIGWSGGMRDGYRVDGVSYLYYYYTMSYYTTVDQEAEVDRAVNELKYSLGLMESGKSSYEKIKAIYDYICQNVTYDYTGTTLLKHTAYAALIKKAAVCQGYALLFYRLALECGVDARIVAGESLGGGHGWNIVKLGNTYYDLDPTWDASRYYTGYEYFLKSEKNFETNHRRYYEYTLDEFCSLYPMAESDFDVNHNHVYGNLTLISPATCTRDGSLVKTCSVCEKAEIRKLPAVGHTYGEWETVQEAGCTEEGSQIRICSACGFMETRTLPAVGHTEVPDERVEATCMETGKTEGSHCLICSEILTAQEPIDTMDHSWGPWKTVSEATVFSAKVRERSCTLCHSRQTETVGEKLKKRISVTALSMIMQTGQKTKALKVTCARGDAVKSWRSSNIDIVKISGNSKGTSVITAGNKAGEAKITIRLKSGLKKVVKVKVRKERVSTISIRLSASKVTLGKGESFTLGTAIAPITSQDKVTYASSDKKIVTVTSKGLVRGLKPGKVKITVKAGRCKAVCTVTVKAENTTL